MYICMYVCMYTYIYIYIYDNSNNNLIPLVEARSPTRATCKHQHTHIKLHTHISMNNQKKE